MLVQDTPSRKLDQYIIRLPDGMRDRIKRAASLNRRSMNAEIVATLMEKYLPMTDSVEDLREQCPFSADIFELIKKHYPEAYTGNAKDNVIASRRLAMALSTLMSSVYFHRNRATGDYNAKEMIKFILDNMQGIENTTLQILRENLNA